MSDMDNSGRPEITGDLLMSLHSLSNSSATEAATARGEYASMVKSRVETHGLNAKAFKMASSVRKMENGKREHFVRDLLHYMDLMQVHQQKSLLDTMADNQAGTVRTDLDKRLDGEPVEAAADSEGKPVEARVNAPLKPTSPMGKHTVNAYRDLVEGLTERDEINTGLERFCADHPKLADEATMIVKDRLRRLGEEQGGGEDLRPAAAREGEQAEAAQAGQTGKRTGKGKRAGGEHLSVVA